MRATVTPADRGWLLVPFTDADPVRIFPSLQEAREAWDAAVRSREAHDCRVAGCEPWQASPAVCS